MIRNLKVLGLALVAVLAFAAMSASAASAANGTLTSDGPFTLTGTDEPATHALTAFESNVECHGHYIGERSDGTDLQSGDTTVTLTPTYTNCTVEGGVFPTTVTMNGCDYLLHLGETTGVTDTYHVTADLNCPKGAEVVIHLYLNAEAHARNESFCTISVAPVAGIGGATLKDETNGHLTLGGSAGPFTSTRSGTLCPSGSDTNAHLDLAATIEGKNSSGGETPVSISHP